MPRILLAAMLVGLLAAPAVSRAQAAADPVVAQRGDTKITASTVREWLRSVDADQRSRLQADPQGLVTLVRDRLLQAAVLAEAHAKQWDQRPEIVARAEQAHDAAIADSFVASLSQPEAGYPSEAEVQTAYDQNKAKLMVPRQYHIGQIFVAVPAGAPKATDDEARAKAADLRAQALRPKADFAALAKKASDDKRTGAAGGDIGWVREDQLLPQIRTAVSGMTEGAISDPLRLQDGWHLIRLAGTKPAGPASLSDVHDGLVRALRQARQQQNARAYLDGLLAREPVQLNEIELGNISIK